MRRLAVIFLITILLAATIPSILVVAEPVYTPHEDPATAESAMDAYSFFTYYSDIFTLISSKMYANATLLAEQLKFVYISEDLTYIIQRYNNLTLELTQTLDNLESLLSRASALLSQYRLDEASQTLNEAGIIVGRAEILMKDLTDATQTLSSSFGVFAAPAGSKVKQAYDTLQGLLQKLNQLVSDYLERLMSIKNEKSTIESESLNSTEVTLSLNTTEAFVGEPIEATGTLTTNGTDFPNRTITILFDNSPTATTTTGIDGSYNTTTAIPYQYVHNMTATALYAPSATDVGVYLACISSPVYVETMFNETRLEITTPSEAYPGLPITVRANVTSEDTTPLSQRGVSVFLDNNLLANVETDPQGYVNVETTLSPQTPTGSHTVTVAVDPQNVYAGASQTKALSVVKNPSEITVQVPSFLILPTKVDIKGNASSTFGPLQDATITLTLADNVTTAKTSKNGEFSATIDLPSNLMLSVGFQGLKITVEPAEPWNAPTQREMNIFVVNPANIALASVAFVCVGTVMYTTKSKSAKRKERETLRVVSLPSRIGLPKITLFQTQIKLEGTKGRIVAAYVKALQTVQRATSISLAPQMTLREFLQATKPKLNGAADSFADLTFMAERTLYSLYMPTENDAEKADDLTLNIQRKPKLEPA
jgi:hypothetical protein